MSILSEQKRALKNTRDFLKYVLTDRSKWTKRELRDKADLCYKHFPFLDEDGTPVFSNE